MITCLYHSLLGLARNVQDAGIVGGQPSQLQSVSLSAVLIKVTIVLPPHSGSNAFPWAGPFFRVEPQFAFEAISQYNPPQTSQNSKSEKVIGRVADSSIQLLPWHREYR
jgi:hypothetical protein